MQEKGIVNLRKEMAKLKTKVKTIEDYLILQQKHDENTAKIITHLLEKARRNLEKSTS